MTKLSLRERFGQLGMGAAESRSLGVPDDFLNVVAAVVRSGPVSASLRVREGEQDRRAFREPVADRSGQHGDDERVGAYALFVEIGSWQEIILGPPELAGAVDRLKIQAVL